jgi:hypothetical protein
MGHELARLFKYDHLPEHLQEVSKPFAELADKLMYEPAMLMSKTIQYECLMKLWEAKNLAVVMVAQYN